MVHHKETHVAIEQHDGKVSSAVIETMPVFLSAKAPKQNMLAMDLLSMSLMNAGQGPLLLLLLLGMKPGMASAWLWGQRVLDGASWGLLLLWSDGKALLSYF